MLRQLITLLSTSCDFWRILYQALGIRNEMWWHRLAMAKLFSHGKNAVTTTSSHDSGLLANSWNFSQHKVWCATKFGVRVHVVGELSSWGSGGTVTPLTTFLKVVSDNDQIPSCCFLITFQLLSLVFPPMDCKAYIQYIVKSGFLLSQRYLQNYLLLFWYKNIKNENFVILYILEWQTGVTEM